MKPRSLNYEVRAHIPRCAACQRLTLASIFLLVLAASTPSRATTYGSFGPHGEGGSKNGQIFKIGAGGSVFELDAFLAVNGADLNGAQPGTAAQLSQHPLPAGLDSGFNATQPNGTDALLTYGFTNISSGTFTNLRFAVLVDAEIDQETNTFFNEYGGVIGTPGAGASDVAADSWQVDEPGFANGSLFNNLYAFQLSNSNAIPVGASNDVAFGLGLLLGDLAPGQSVVVSVLLSDAGHYLGTFGLQQFDRAPASGTAITVSAILSTLTGTIYRDGNTNNAADPGEGLAGVAVQLLAGEITVGQTTTDTGGNYSFPSPPAGNYTVKINTATLPAGLTNSVDPDGVLDNETTTSLAPGQLRILNWGYRVPAGSEVFGDVSGLVQFGITWRLKASTGTLLGTLSLTNLPPSGVTLSAPFQMGLPTSTNFWLARPVGTLANSVPYVNITTGVVAQAGSDGVLSPGERVVVVDGIEIYSRNRTAPPLSLFQFWATQQP